MPFETFWQNFCVFCIISAFLAESPATVSLCSVLADIFCMVCAKYLCAMQNSSAKYARFFARYYVEQVFVYIICIFTPRRKKRTKPQTVSSF